MPKYTVGFVVSGTVWVDVEADNPDDAKKAAWKKASYGICHQCSGKVEMDDWTGQEIVLDEDGNEIERSLGGEG
jgi:hypothetical protein